MVPKDGGAASSKEQREALAQLPTAPARGLDSKAEEDAVMREAEEIREDEEEEEQEQRQEEQVGEKGEEGAVEEGRQSPPPATKNNDEDEDEDEDVGDDLFG